MPRSKIIKISHDLEPEMPIFSGNRPNKIKQINSFKKGDTWNSYLLTIFNHNGTHIDAPNHFDRLGKRICDYGVEDFIFCKPLLIDIPKSEGEGISKIDLVKTVGGAINCDILLIRTGFYRERKKIAYVKNGPWLMPEAAEFIRGEFKRVKAVGIDAISIASFQHLTEGGESHQILQKERGFSTSPIMIIEDLNLAHIPKRIRRLYAIPLFVSGVDSMPCTAFVKVE